jgi:phosphate-selective porin OprO and OprP
MCKHTGSLRFLSDLLCKWYVWALVIATYSGNLGAQTSAPLPEKKNVPSLPWLYTQEKQTAEEKEADTAVRVEAKPGRGFKIARKDGKSSIGIFSQVQMRSSTIITEHEKRQENAIKTLRLRITGSVLSPRLIYATQLAWGKGDFETDNPSPIFDMYLEYRVSPELRVRAGQFLVQFDRGRTIIEYALNFIERPLMIRELTLNRDIGIMLWSDHILKGGHFGYKFSVAGGDGRNRFGEQELGPLVLMRLAFRPWGGFDDMQDADLKRLPRPRMAIGIASAYNFNTDRQSSTFGTIFKAGRVNYAHRAIDLMFKYAGLYVLAEAVDRRASLNSISKNMDDGTKLTEYTRSAYGYMVNVGYLVLPKVELVARYEQMVAYPGTDPAFQKKIDTEGRQYGGGFNVYLNGHFFKLQSNLIRIDGVAQPHPHTALFFQLDASF